MAIDFTEMGNGVALEHQNNFRLTFTNDGGGTGSVVPLNYVTAGDRYTTTKELADVLSPFTAYKVNSIHSLIAVNSDDSQPDDLGAEVPGATWIGYATMGSDPTRHKVSFFLPGALFVDDASAETLGQLIATTLGANHRFKRWANARR